MNTPTRISEHRLLGVRFHQVTRQLLMDEITQAANTNTRKIICNINIHALNTACKDTEFKSIINHSDLVFVDGAGVSLGASLAGIQAGERLTPADWIDELLANCADRHWPIYWLGDTEEVGSDFEQKILAKHPNCLFAGRHHGFFHKEGADNDAVVAHINASNARILLIGMSMPIQEKWLWRNQHRLNPAVLLPVGGLARIYTGRIRRGPRWITNHGFEWLYRLTVQPRYTWKRYLIGNPLFILRVLAERLGLKRYNAQSNQ